MAVKAKICGLVRPQDATLAVQHGAAALGVVFAGGPRRVTAEQAREVVMAAADIPVLGVFGEQSVAEILATVAATGLRGVQLHRAGSALEHERLAQAGLIVWQMVPYGGPDPVEGPHPSTVDLWLLEPWHPGGGGGRGAAGDLHAARRCRDHLPTERVGLAGGLTPERVSEAIEVVRPAWVDVSSGVERAPGIKDPVRLVRFLEMVRDAGSLI